MSDKPVGYVLLGKQPKEGGEFLKTLQSRFPTELPKEFVSSINIITNDRFIEISGSMLKENLKLRDPQFLSRTFGIDFDVTRVEVILDIDKAEEILSVESNKLLSNVFYT